MISGPPIALALTAERKIDFNDAFGIQFLVSKNPKLQVGNFSQKKAGEWNLYSGANLPLCTLRDRHQKLVGFFLGIGVDRNGNLVDEEFANKFDLSYASFNDSIEEEISNIAGRYIFILVNSKSKRIYFDPCATLSAVFDPSTETIASSLTLCLDRDIKENPSFDNDDILSGVSNYLFQHTRDENVKLVLANHFLCLDTFKMIRHWPKPDDTFTSTSEDYPYIAKDIVNRMSDIFGAIAKNHKCIVPITGGVDSRIMISSGIRHLHDVELFFTFGHNFMSRLDVKIGSLIAKKLRIPFRSFDTKKDENRHLPKGFHKRQLLYKFWIASGYSFKTPQEIKQDLLQYLPRNYIHLRANVVDLLKGTNFPKSASAKKSIKEKRIHELCSLLRQSSLSDEMIERWLPEYMERFNSLPKKSRKVSNDLLYIELIHPSFAQLFYGMNETFYFYPYSDRRFISNAFKFPIKYRKSGAATNLVQEKALTSLSEIPFLHDRGARGSQQLFDNTIANQQRDQSLSKST